MCVNKNWTVEYTDEFEAWWVELTEGMQDDIDRVVMLLEEHGPMLGFPYSSAINGARFAMRELRIQSDGHPIRILYVDLLCCLLEVIRLEMTGGISKMCPKRSVYLRNI